MRSLLVVLGVLLAGLLLYLLWDAEPSEAPRGTSESLRTAEAEGAPKLGTTGLIKRDEAEEERQAAKALLDELRDLDVQARIALLQARYAADPTAKIPYSEALVRLFLEMLSSSDSMTQLYGASYLRMLGPRAAPLINEELSADPKGPRSLILLRLLTHWRAMGLEFPVPDLTLFLGEDRPGLHRQVLQLLARGVPYEEKLAQRLLEMFRARPLWDMHGPGVGLARMGKQGPEVLMAFFDAAESAGERVAVLQCLARTKPENLKPLLPTFSQLILDKQLDAQTRFTAIYTLAAMQGDCVECLPALRAALNDDSYEFIKPCAKVLASMGMDAAPAVPDLLRWLEVDDPTIGDPTASALAHIGARPDLVLPALDKMVRTFASDAGARAMAFFGPAALPYALKILDEGDEYAQYAVLWAIAGLREKAASTVPRLLELVNGEDEDIALRAIGTLGYIGPKASAAVPEIMRRTMEGEAVLGAKAAAGALANMGGDAEKAMLRSLRSSKPAERRRALSILTHFHMHTAFAFDELESFAASKDAGTRVDAYRAIGAAFFNPQAPWPRQKEGLDPELIKRARTLFERGVKDKDPSVIAAAHQGLSYLTYQEEP